VTDNQTTRVYSITVDGFDPVRFWASSASAARYQAFKALREAGYRYEFRDFPVLCSNEHRAGPAGILRDFAGSPPKRERV
jgi:hypothetical protein